MKYSSNFARLPSIKNARIDFFCSVTSCFWTSSSICHHLLVKGNYGVKHVMLFPKIYCVEITCVITFGIAYFREINVQDFYCILAQSPRTISRNMQLSKESPLFFSWPKLKMDFLVHCSLYQYYRAATTIISDTLNCHFLVFITSGHCQIIAQMNYEEISVCACVMKTGPSTLKNFHPVLPPGGTLDVSGINLRISSKISFSAARKKTLNTKKIPLQSQLTESSQPSSTSKTNQHHSFSLTPIAKQPSAPKFITIIPPRWRPPSTACSTCIYGPPTPTSPWAFILTVTVWLRRT
ncbi:uncharacterized protein LOC109451675 [Rhinolophus sinicus]|uniref:uncharacterized protein LOC109451675 n=1 Tax=Rhinolophus sinicus TaxID=89399 RepID=UPI003D79D5A6